MEENNHPYERKRRIENYPIEILGVLDDFDDLYIIGVVNPNGNEGEAFRKAHILDRIEYLVNKKPGAKRIIEKEVFGEDFYFSLIGNFIVSFSPKEEYYEFDSREFAKKMAKEFHSNLKKEYFKMNSSYHKLESFFSNNKPLHPKKPIKD